MKSFYSTTIKALSMFALFILIASVSYAQDVNTTVTINGKKTKVTGNSRTFCDQPSDWGSNKSVKTLIEKTIPAESSLKVDGMKNGGISIIGSERNDILIKACVQAWGKTEEEAGQLLSKIRLETDPVVRGVSDSEESYWSVSFDVYVPQNINLDLKTRNGGIIIKNVQGSLEFEAINGGIVIENAGGNIKGSTKNGGIIVKLNNEGWKGDGLDVSTTNGGIKLDVPENFAGEVFASTVNGGFHSNLKGLTTTKGKWSGGQASGVVNGGGAKIRLTTINGGVSIN